MTLPRWTAYVALAVIAVIFVTALPKSSRHEDEGGAARAVRERAEPHSTTVSLADPTFKRVVVLGIDGMDPEILAEVIERYPDRMPNFRGLIEQSRRSNASPIRELGTSTPPQSPVAWSNFITGRNPGGHGIFDFVHRNPETYSIASSTVTETTGGEIHLPGPYKFPLGGGGESNRTGRSFWTILADHGVPADVWRMPINYPVDPAEGLSFPGMMTPALDSAYGEFTFYTTDPPADTDISGGKFVQISHRQVESGEISTTLYGPPNAVKEGDPTAQLPIKIYVDREAGAAVIDLGTDRIVLEPGEWSEFKPVTFSLLPMWMMDLSGIVRFYLRSIEPEFELYASPINFDPRSPVEPVSSPSSASSDLADVIGLYNTKGMAEDVGALKAKVLTDAEFMQQAEHVFVERNRMLDYALDKYLEDDEGGFLFFYYSTVDLCAHMMWRHQDTDHPYHDAELAREDSSWWTGRGGSTWQTTIDDLYLKMDPVLGTIRERVGEDTLIIVMSDHGFAPYRRKFNLNTWLLDEGYLVLQEGKERERAEGDPDHQGEVHLADAVDWTKTRAYGIGFNGLYLNLRGREAQGIVEEADKSALLTEIANKLEAFPDEDNDDARVVVSADIAADVYEGERLAEAPDIIVGYDSGYGNSDEATLGRIERDVLMDNTGGTFNGSHLMDPSVVAGMLLTNAEISLEDPRLEDLTVEILTQYGIEKDGSMDGRPVFK